MAKKKGDIKKIVSSITEEITQGIAEGISNGIKNGTSSSAVPTQNVNNTNSAAKSQVNVAKSEQNAIHGAEARKKVTSEAQERKTVRETASTSKAIDNLASTVKESVKANAESTKSLKDFISTNLSKAQTEQTTRLKETLDKNSVLVDKIKDVLTEDTKVKEDSRINDLIEAIGEKLENIYGSLERANKEAPNALIQKIAEVLQKRDTSSYPADLKSFIQSLQNTSAEILQTVKTFTVQPIQTPTVVETKQVELPDLSEVTKSAVETIKDKILSVYSTVEKKLDSVINSRADSLSLSQAITDTFNSGIDRFNQAYTDSITRLSSDLKNMFSGNKMTPTTSGSSVDMSYAGTTEDNVQRRNLPYTRDDTPINVSIVGGLDGVVAELRAAAKSDIVSSDADLDRRVQGRTNNRLIRFLEKRYSMFGSFMSGLRGEKYGSSITELALNAFAIKALSPYTATLIKLVPTVMKTAGVVAGVAGTAYTVYQNFQEAEMHRAKGEDRAADRKNAATWTGTAIGGALGAAFGGPVGIAFGSYLGSVIGKYAGNILAREVSDLPMFSPNKALGEVDEANRVLFKEKKISEASVQSGIELDLVKQMYNTGDYSPLFGLIATAKEELKTGSIENREKARLQLENYEIFAKEAQAYWSSSRLSPEDMKIRERAMQGMHGWIFKDSDLEKAVKDVWNSGVYLSPDELKSRQDRSINNPDEVKATNLKKYREAEEKAAYVTFFQNMTDLSTNEAEKLYRRLQNTKDPISKTRLVAGELVDLGPMEPKEIAVQLTKEFLQKRGFSKEEIQENEGSVSMLLTQLIEEIRSGKESDHAAIARFVEVLAKVEDTPEKFVNFETNRLDRTLADIQKRYSPMESPNKEQKEVTSESVSTNTEAIPASTIPAAVPGTPAVTDNMIEAIPAAKVGEINLAATGKLDTSTDLSGDLADLSYSMVTLQEAVNNLERSQDFGEMKIESSDHRLYDLISYHYSRNHPIFVEILDILKYFGGEGYKKAKEASAQAVGGNNAAQSSGTSMGSRQGSSPSSNRGNQSGGSGPSGQPAGSPSSYNGVNPSLHNINLADLGTEQRNSRGTRIISPIDINKRDIGRKAGYNAAISEYISKRDQRTLIDSVVSGASLESGVGSRYSLKKGSKDHEGLDLAAPLGTPIKASFDGKISYVGSEKNYGNYVDIDYGNGYSFRYAHLPDNVLKDLKKGDSVFAGQQFATVGNTGRSSGPHLHMEAKKDGIKIDPMMLLDAAYKNAAKSANIDNSTNLTDKASVTGNVNQKDLNRRVDLGSKAPTQNMQAVMNNYGAHISEMSKKYNVPENLIYGMIQTESSGRTDAVSKAGAAGLMQLMPGTARGLGVTDAFDPKQNIEGGTKYIGQMLKKFDGNVEQALQAYNWGPGNMQKHIRGEKPNMPKETQAYANKVLRYADQYKTIDQTIPSESVQTQSPQLAEAEQPDLYGYNGLKPVRDLNQEKIREVQAKDPYYEALMKQDMYGAVYGSDDAYYANIGTPKQEYDKMTGNIEATQKIDWGAANFNQSLDNDRWLIEESGKPVITDPLANRVEEYVPIKQFIDSTSDVSSSFAEAERARIQLASGTTADGVAKSVTSGFDSLSEVIKPAESRAEVGVRESGEASQISEEETRAVSEYVLRYIFGENASGAGVLQIF